MSHSDKPAPMEREDVVLVIEHMRTLLAKNFGVTAQEDANGAWGRAGARYITLRFRTPRDPADMITVTMTIDDIRSSVQEYNETQRDNMNQ